MIDSLITCKSIKLVDDISNQVKVVMPKIRFIKQIVFYDFRL